MCVHQQWKVLTSVKQDVSTDLSKAKHGGYEQNRSLAVEWLQPKRFGEIDSICRKDFDM